MVIYEVEKCSYSEQKAIFQIHFSMGEKRTGKTSLGNNSEENEEKLGQHGGLNNTRKITLNTRKKNLVTSGNENGTLG